LIKVGGLTADVRVVKDVSEEAKVHGDLRGQFSIDADETHAQILVESDRRPRYRASAYLHELGHFAIEAARRKAPVKSEEDYVLAFETLFDILWKDGWRPNV
jgi:hypothetical protein